MWKLMPQRHDKGLFPPLSSTISYHSSKENYTVQFHFISPQKQRRISFSASVLPETCFLKLTFCNLWILNVLDLSGWKLSGNVTVFSFEFDLHWVVLVCPVSACEGRSPAGRGPLLRSWGHRPTLNQRSCPPLTWPLLASVDLIECH